MARRRSLIMDILSEDPTAAEPARRATERRTKKTHSTRHTSAPTSTTQGPPPTIVVHGGLSFHLDDVMCVVMLKMLPKLKVLFYTETGDDMGDSSEGEGEGERERLYQDEEEELGIQVEEAGWDLGEWEEESIERERGRGSRPASHRHRERGRGRERGRAVIDQDSYDVIESIKDRAHQRLQESFTESMVDNEVQPYGSRVSRQGMRESILLAAQAAGDKSLDAFPFAPFGDEDPEALDAERESDADDDYVYVSGDEYDSCIDASVSSETDYEGVSPRCERAREEEREMEMETASRYERGRERESRRHRRHRGRERETHYHYPMDGDMDRGVYEREMRVDALEREMAMVADSLARERVMMRVERERQMERERERERYYLKGPEGRVTSVVAICSYDVHPDERMGEREREYRGQDEYWYDEVTPSHPYPRDSGYEYDHYDYGYRPEYEYEGEEYPLPSRGERGRERGPSRRHHRRGGRHHAQTQHTPRAHTAHTHRHSGRVSSRVERQGSADRRPGGRMGHYGHESHSPGYASRQGTFPEGEREREAHPTRERGRESIRKRAVSQIERVHSARVGQGREVQSRVDRHRQRQRPITVGGREARERARERERERRHVERPVQSTRAKRERQRERQAKGKAKGSTRPTVPADASLSHKAQAILQELAMQEMVSEDASDHQGVRLTVPPGMTGLPGTGPALVRPITAKGGRAGQRQRERGAGIGAQTDTQAKETPDSVWQGPVGVGSLSLPGALGWRREADRIDVSCVPTAGVDYPAPEALSSIQNSLLRGPTPPVGSTPGGSAPPMALLSGHNVQSQQSKGTHHTEREREREKEAMGMGESEGEAEGERSMGDREYSGLSRGDMPDCLPDGLTIAPQSAYPSRIHSMLLPGDTDLDDLSDIEGVAMGGMDRHSKGVGTITECGGVDRSTQDPNPADMSDTSVTRSRALLYDDTFDSHDTSMGHMGIKGAEDTEPDTDHISTLIGLFAQANPSAIPSLGALLRTLSSLPASEASTVMQGISTRLMGDMIAEGEREGEGEGGVVTGASASNATATADDMDGEGEGEGDMPMRTPCRPSLTGEGLLPPGVVGSDGICHSRTPSRGGQDFISPVCDTVRRSKATSRGPGSMDGFGSPTQRVGQRHGDSGGMGMGDTLGQRAMAFGTIGSQDPEGMGDVDDMCILTDGESDGMEAGQEAGEVAMVAALAPVSVVPDTVPTEDDAHDVQGAVPDTVRTRRVTHWGVSYTVPVPEVVPTTASTTPTEEGEGEAGEEEAAEGETGEDAEDETEDAEWPIPGDWNDQVNALEGGAGGEGEGETAGVTNPKGVFGFGLPRSKLAQYQVTEAPSGIAAEAEAEAETETEAGDVSADVHFSMPSLSVSMEDDMGVMDIDCLDLLPSTTLSVSSAPVPVDTDASGDTDVEGTAGTGPTLQMGPDGYIGMDDIEPPQAE
ncbi:hypothetical protein KIPB_007405 [Kipferlia bialata]|uniref:Uncharacterized protein n=1 Tax=Kipferlia bialata TaxID=797122 RepID=A0A9K3GJ17_9EUKA|nr:hypothetical protein KIPB_007405 [Kipferlia bialata]|eukprot:g7405.t1